MSSSGGMSGPVGPTRGPRFASGYQFPRTHSARLLPAPQPIRVERLGDGAYAEIRPLTGSIRGTMYEVSGRWRARGRDGETVHVQSSSYATDVLEATTTFVQLVRRILAEKSRGVDAIA